MTCFFFYCNAILAHLIGTITEWEFNEVLVSVKIKGKHWAHRNTSVYVSSDWYSIIQLGCSDHETVKFKILRLVRRVHGKFATLLIRRADLGLLGDLLCRVLWDKALEGRGVQENWLILKDCLFHNQEQWIPKEKSGKNARQPMWMNKQLLDKIKQKKGSLQRMEARIDSLRGIHWGCPSSQG